MMKSEFYRKNIVYMTLKKLADLPVRYVEWSDCAEEWRYDCRNIASTCLLKIHLM